ncbi:hypothetical protein IF655_01220 [Streptomyces sp. DSM 110735]|uniref:hypothetical protein n=1 Tax=Streptomyces sp. DSM 110735 TaxID=2775031 RepID=UPI0018F2AE0D|nr:hypothetical protein [Streptomyces sp. DSM 110735]MBJ7901923.1 hypothetical protein [Streptomyces sp. DSM 110735]
MAHAAPAPGARTGGARTSGEGEGEGDRLRTGPTPDVFDARAHRMLRIVVPVLLALVYGYWAAANRRSGGPITGWNLLFGFLTALVFAVVLIALLTVAPRLPRELHAAAWTVFIGCSFGFLYSQTGDSIYRSVGNSIAIGVVTFIVFFYRFYTREDAAGHRIH